MAIITINEEKITGRIKPLHGVNNFPSLAEWQLNYLKHAGIPYSRLHDTFGRFGAGEYVDISNIFKNFDADENDPDSYSFELTDFVVKSLIEKGVQVFYRLGESIEHTYTIKRIHTKKPKDFSKWARICERIVSHYNDGWANGFHYNIKYWEIYCEPEGPAFWEGTKEEYYELYRLTANLLKEKHPEIQVGGYASCGFYQILGVGVATEANVPADRAQYFIDFFKGFLEYVSAEKTKAPLDFFSWHSYGSVDQNVLFARYVRVSLDEYGFTETISIFDEFNPGKRNRGKLIDACLIATNFLALQKEPLDMLMYYDAQITSNYCGMFNPITNEPFKAYYSFKAFNELYKLKNEVETQSDDKELYCVGAKQGDTVAVMVANISDNEKTITLKGLQKIDTVNIFVIDETHEYGAKIYYCDNGSVSVDMEKNSVLLLKIN